MDAEAQFTGNKTNDVYLRLQLNLLVTELEPKDLEFAKLRVKQYLKYFKKSFNLLIKTQFFIQAGIIHRRLELYKKAYSFFDDALKLAIELNHIRYQSLIYNNLANTYRSEQKFDLAFEFIDLAFELANDAPGWTANFLDTKANIYHDFGDYQMAERCIDEAIQIFRIGDDLGGLLEALWTRVKILINLDSREEAFEQFITLYLIATERIGSDTAEIYIKKFLELCPPIPTGNFFERMNTFKKMMLENSLDQSNYQLTQAARILGISHQTFRRNLDRFPELNYQYRKNLENKTPK